MGRGAKHPSPAGPVIAAVALLAAAMLAPSALAAKKKGPATKTVEATATTTTNAQAVTVTATCPKGMSALGGGFSTGVGTSGGTLNAFHAVSSARRTATRDFTVTATRFGSDAAGPLPVTAEANCRRAPGKVSVVSQATAPGDATSFQTGASACPSKRTSVGSGFRVGGPAVSSSADFFMLALRPVGSAGWASAMLTTEDDLNLTTDAICRKGRHTTAVRSAATSLPLSTGPLGVAITPNCPKKLTPFAGGFSANFYSAAALPAIVSSRREGRGWQVAAVNLSSGDPGQLTAHALCS